MQPTPAKENAMRPTTLLAPVIEVERRVIAAERQRFAIAVDELTGGFEISEEEILDDLLYPSDHLAPQRPAGPSRGGPARSR
jgi:hypothetical protein